MENRRKAMPLVRLITYFAICQGEKLSAACMIDRAGPFTGLHFFFFLNGASSCENLRSSHGSYESSREPDLSWNAKSLIQADILPWPRNLGKRHCDKVASYLTAFLLK